MRDELRKQIQQAQMVRGRAMAAAESATTELRGLVILGNQAGIPETELAKLAGVTRMTVRAWLGKS